ncbi:MAG: DUF5658 family protein [Gammaproteobacteria bacterium]
MARANEETDEQSRSAGLVLGQLTGQKGPAPGVLRERRDNQRRSHSWPSFLYGGLRPRRRAGRRSGDEQEIFLDWHEPRVLYLALGILLMSCLDALFTLNILAGGGRELNGVMDKLIQADKNWFVAGKIAITGTGVVLLTIAVKRQFLGRVRVIRVLELFCAGYAALIVWELYLLTLMFPYLAADFRGLLPGWLG